MLVGDYVAMEKGYWDEQADQQEWQALHTYNIASAMTDTSKISPYHLMPKWVLDYRDIQIGESKEEVASAFETAKKMTEKLNSI